MNWVDALIVGIVILAAIWGWFQGAIRQVCGWIGLIAGFYVGIAIAPSLSTKITHSSWRPILALVIAVVEIRGEVYLGHADFAALKLDVAVVAAYVGNSLGHLLGSTIRKTVKMVKLGLVDSVAGVVVGVAGALITVWLVAALLVATSWSTAASGIQGSRIIDALDKALPTVPSAEARLQSLLRNADFPSVFTSTVSPTVPFSGAVPTHPPGHGLLHRATPRSDERARGGGRHQRHGRGSDRASSALRPGERRRGSSRLDAAEHGANEFRDDGSVLGGKGRGDRLPARRHTDNQPFDHRRPDHLGVEGPLRHGDLCSRPARRLHQHRTG